MDQMSHLSPRRRVRFITNPKNPAGCRGLAPAAHTVLLLKRRPTGAEL
jgi:hypothetical protein